MTLSRFLLAAAALALLSGCMLFESPAARALRKSPNYSAGYSDGCASATKDGADMAGGDTVRDDELYRSDKAYRAGWSGGFSACRTANTYRPGQDGPVPSQNPGGGGLPY